MSDIQTLKGRIMEWMAHDDWVSFAEVRRRFPDETGTCALQPAKLDNIAFWFGMSASLCDAFRELLAEQKIFLHPASMLTYLIDGSMPRLPVAKRARSYKELHWAPVCIRTVPLGKVQQLRTARSA